ncbi:hypothetical protein [Nonomuraea sp. NPDC050310]|uniref:hypothetical protein n=1 Tax=Nonomuraea sp. NPDC050310 TaxID=3154935 RepID=UPI0033DE7EE5
MINTIYVDWVPQQRTDLEPSPAPKSPPCAMAIEEAWGRWSEAHRVPAGQP